MTIKKDATAAAADNGITPEFTAAEPNLATEIDPRVNQALGIFADLSALKVSPAEVIAAEEVMTTISVRKPRPNEFVRAQDQDLTTLLYQDKEEGDEYFFIVPHMRPHFINGIVVKMLVPAVNQLGLPFIWPVPVDDGQSGSRNGKWNESHRGAYKQAKVEWTKVVSDRAAKQYRTYRASGKLPPPRFCPRPFNEQIALAFSNGRIIDDPEHPVLRAMRGDIP
jgi:hypothetical protein